MFWYYYLLLKAKNSKFDQRIGQEVNEILEGKNLIRRWESHESDFFGLLSVTLSYFMVPMHAAGAIT
jgi:hypothetical protein